MPELLNVTFASNHLAKRKESKSHCHYSGLYRGAAHSSCNLQYKIPSYIPVVFHNLAGYDAHLFIRELAKYTTGMNVIAKNMEDYISWLTVAGFLSQAFDPASTTLSRQ